MAMIRYASVIPRPEWRPESAVSNWRTALRATVSEASILINPTIDSSLERRSLIERRRQHSVEVPTGVGWEPEGRHALSTSELMPVTAFY
jgi:hypothetical protein